ncbi:hypothetical protein [Elizabethkingia anophelis]|uniref:hypothetical protein n=1 Tax=Elizabethkingia anophelis TaxID=1117645 RepID=UPI001689E7F1|nr:hypothetical protein [Elizabethkingia anophelis]MDV3636693.1 hypothetical protein [Elizabethkingia anophelis]QNV11288.1 hypothetical protein EIY88_18980 [Elizabethkingia anophelis]UTF89428.1 hypothetical protein J2N93_19030 [Elizabethkingia anophelis]UTG04048.1 hypothetical protein J2O03_18930 [Elizabethkingia anophelis]UTG07791.1 hypothetical protein J2N99_18915 [Elizabethkingia anophelis]
MNKIITAFAICIYSLSFSQVFNIERIKEDALNKEQNYSNALSWASLNSKEIRVKKIIASDSGLGMVSMNINAFISDNIATYYNVEFNLKIEVKDKKYKVSYLSPVVKVGIKQDYLYGASSKTLNNMKKNLQIIESLSKKKFDSKLEWNYDDINKAKNDYSLSIDEINTVVDLLHKLEGLQKSIDGSIDETMSKNNDW